MFALDKGNRSSYDNLETVIVDAVKKAVMDLDNGICDTSSACCPAHEEREGIMKQRIKVQMGTDTEGKKLYKWIQAETQDELNDKIVQCYITSGRIWDFISNPAAEKPQEEENGITFKEYTENWLATYKKKELKPTTLRGYRTILDTHFYPAFGDKPFASITTLDLQNFLNEREHLSKKYLGDMVKFFGMISKDAMEDNVLTKDATASRKLSIPSQKKTEREALSRENFLDIENHLQDLRRDDRTLLAMLMYTGMRRGEVLGLKWEDIDWENKLIHVSRNVTYAENQPTIGTTKTESGVRSIPLTSQLEKYLMPKKELGFIIGGESPITKITFVRAWERINKAIELHGATPHIFRHTYLTFLVASGTDMKTVQAVAGHSNIQVTMNRYVHAQTDNIKKAGEVLENKVFFAGNLQNTSSLKPA